MSFSRRDFIKYGAGGSLVAGLSGSAVESSHALPAGIGEAEGVDLIVNGKLPTVEAFAAEYSTPTGVSKPYREEIETTARILSELKRSGRTTTPFETANFFYDLSMGLIEDSKNKIRFDKRYAQEWPVRANPLIVTFFNATNYGDPRGDTTAWCAAFVNWCLVESSKGRGNQRKLVGPTKSAASKSFRDWGDKVSKPNVGDLAVFALKSDPNHGHVCFFVADAGDKFFGLGGNQGALDRRNNGEVNLKALPKENSYWKLHSYRTGPDLMQG